MKDSQSYRLCYISKKLLWDGRFGNKAKTDNEKTLAAMGARNLGMRQTLHRNKILAFFLDLAGIIKFSCTVRRGDVVVLQYPIKILCVHLRHGTSARSKDCDADTRPGIVSPQEAHRGKEIARLSHTDYVIASNEVMQQWLADKGFKKGLGALGLFDYLSPSEPATSHAVCPPPHRLCRALAMRKNAFILHLPDVIENYELHILETVTDCTDCVTATASSSTVLHLPTSSSALWMPISDWYGTAIRSTVVRETSANICVTTVLTRFRLSPRRSACHHLARRGTGWHRRERRHRHLY